MFSSFKIPVSKALYERAKTAAEKQGASSLEEFVQKIIEKEVDKVLSPAMKHEATSQEIEDITSKMKGLGYLE